MPKFIDNYLTHAEHRVLALALSSRLFVLLLMAVADTVFSDLDSSSHLQNFPCGSLNKTAPLEHNISYNSWLARFLDGLAPWDSVYFVRIAKCGYETDMVNAFFPFLPFLMRYGAKYTGIEYIGTELLDLPIESVYTGIGLGVSVFAFCIAAISLHRLSNKILVGNEELSSMAVLLFCCNPASVFYSAAYTEALFAACTWAGLVLLTSEGGGGSKKLFYWAAGVLALSLAGATRSNGILSAWFLVHSFILEVHSSIHSGNKAKKNGLVAFGLLLKTIVGCAVVWAPYIAMQGRLEKFGSI
jgi:GPI mannosyltransferase 2